MDITPRRRIIGGPFDGAWYSSAHAWIATPLAGTTRYALYRLQDDAYRFERTVDESDFDVAVDHPASDDVEKGPSV